MTERPYVWHESKFGDSGSNYPWTVTIGRPKGAGDYKLANTAKTLEEAMEKALKLVPKEVP